MRPIAISIVSAPGGAVVVTIVDRGSPAVFVTGETRSHAIATAAASPHVADDVKALLVNLGGARR